MPYPTNKYKRKNHWNYRRIPWNKNKKCPYLIGNTYGFKKGQPSWIKGKKGYFHHTKETKEKISKAHKGRKITWEIKNKFEAGEKHWNWRGGVSKERELIANRKLERPWAKKVKERDDWTCQKCKAKTGNMIAHHKIFWTPKSKSNYDINNGITLCKKCHKKLHWELLKKRANSGKLPLGQSRAK